MSCFCIKWYQFYIEETVIKPQALLLGGYYIHIHIISHMNNYSHINNNPLLRKGEARKTDRDKVAGSRQQLFIAEMESDTTSQKYLQYFFFFRVFKAYFKRPMISIPNSHFCTITTKQEIEFYSPRDKISYTIDLNKLHFIIYLSILNSTFTSVLPTHVTWFYFSGHVGVFCTLYFDPM